MKAILYVFLVFLLIGTGSLLFSLPNLNVETDDERIDEVLNLAYDVDIPTRYKDDETLVNIDKRNNDSGDESQSEDIPSCEDVGNRPLEIAKELESFEEEKDEDWSLTPVTADELLDQYRFIFEDLQTQATEKLDQLISVALNEYRDLRENDERINYLDLFQKYSGAAEELEDQTDDTFHELYDSLKQELKSNDLDPKAASSFKTQYEEEKASWKNSIITDVMSD